MVERAHKTPLVSSIWRCTVEDRKDRKLGSHAPFSHGYLSANDPLSTHLLLSLSHTHAHHRTNSKRTQDHKTKLHFCTHSPYKMLITSIILAFAASVSAMTVDAAPWPSTLRALPIRQILDNELLPALSAALLSTVTNVAALPTPTSGFATRIRREQTVGPAQPTHTGSSDEEIASLLHMLASAIRVCEDGASTTSAARATASDPPFATQMQELSTGPHHPVPTSLTLEQLEYRVSELLATATFPTATFPPIRSFTRPTVVMERGEPEAKAETVTDDGIV